MTLDPKSAAGLLFETGEPLFFLNPTYSIDHQAYAIWHEAAHLVAMTYLSDEQGGEYYNINEVFVEMAATIALRLKGFDVRFASIPYIATYEHLDTMRGDKDALANEAFREFIVGLAGLLTLEING